MPAKDGTGPMGEGAMTGRGMGNCQTNNSQPRNFFGFGRRFSQGRGAGPGRGFGRMMPWKWNKSNPNSEKE